MEKIFANGLIVKRHEKAPDFVVAALSFKVGEFIEFLSRNDKNGWVNVDVKKSIEGRYYAELNTWDKNVKKVTEEQTNQAEINQVQKDELPAIEYPENEVDPDSIPF